MKNVKKMLLLCVLVLGAMCLAACSGKEDVKNDDLLYGKWAYNHDPENTVLEIKADGTAEFKGEKYDYSRDDQYIILKSKDSELKLRYQQDNEDILVYEHEDYTYVGSDAPDGLTGTWLSDNGWSYEFTEEGSFRENGYFPGHYYELSDSSIKLAYNDHFQDTVLYYKIDGKVLKVEYPWRYVRQ